MANENRAIATMEQRVGRTVEVGKPILEKLGIAPEVFERVAINAIIANPNLTQCSPASFDKSVMTSIEMGLLPDGKQAAIVPYGKTATLVPMVEGQRMLARRATPGIVIRDRAVFAADEFSYSDGLRPILLHIPHPTAPQSDGALIAVYAVATIPGASEPEFIVMFRGEIDRRRAMGAQNGPWATHFIEMAKKAVVKQLLKRLPRVANDISDSIPDALADFTEGYGGQGSMQADTMPYTNGVDAETGEIYEPVQAESVQEAQQPAMDTATPGSPF